MNFHQFGRGDRLRGVSFCRLCVWGFFLVSVLVLVDFNDGSGNLTAGNVQWKLNKRSNQFNRKGPGKALRCSEMSLGVGVE